MALSMVAIEPSTEAGHMMLWGYCDSLVDAWASGKCSLALDFLGRIPELARRALGFHNNEVLSPETALVGMKMVESVPVTERMFQLFVISPSLN